MVASFHSANPLELIRPFQLVRCSCFLCQLRKHLFPDPVCCFVHLPHLWKQCSVHRHALVQQQIVLLQILLSHHSVLSQFRFVLLFLRQSNVRYHKVPLLMICDSLANILHCQFFLHFHDSFPVAFLSVSLFESVDGSAESFWQSCLKLQTLPFRHFQTVSHLTAPYKKNPTGLLLFQIRTY